MAQEPLNDPRATILAQALSELDHLVSGETRESLRLLLGVLSRAIQNSDHIPDKVKAFQDVSACIVQNADLLMLLKQQTAELDALRRISLNLTSRLELKAVLDAVVSEAMSLIRNADDANIFLFREGRLSFGAALDARGVRDKEFARPRPDGLTYTVAHQKQMIVVEDIRTHPLYKDAAQNWKGSIVGIPLTIGSNVVGVMNMARTNIGGFSADEMRLLGILADQAAVAIYNAAVHERVSDEARRDSLTSLPNRRALDERLETEVKRASRSGLPLAVIMMDLDGFKFINDTFGHAVGDHVLVQAFTPLVETLRSSDFLARYGGDELTMVLPETDLPAARIVAAKVQEKLQQTAIHVPATDPVHLDFSGGIAIYPQHGLLASDLLRAADEALYRAKRHQRSSFLVAAEPTIPLTFDRK